MAGSDGTTRGRPRRRGAPAAALVAAAAAALQLAGLSPAGAAWGGASFASAPAAEAAGPCTAGSGSSESAMTGDLYGVSSVQSTTVAVGDDCPSDGYGYGQVSSGATGGQMSFEYGFGSQDPAQMADTAAADQVFYSIACPNTTAFCMAVGTNGEAAQYHDGWSESDVDGTTTLSSVSCTSASFCLAVDDSGGGLAWNGSAWSRSDIDGSVPLDAVKCYSPTWCVAVDGRGDAIEYTGSWGAPSDVDGENALSDVKCTSASFCLAVDDAGRALKWNGTSWAASDVDGTHALDAISCTSATLCWAVDDRGDALEYTGAWGSPATVAAGDALTSVTCVSTTFCMAVDDAGGEDLWNGASWTRTDVDQTVPLLAVNCSTPSFCTALDDRGRALTWAPSAWQETALPEQPGGASCVSAVWCELPPEAAGGYDMAWDGETVSEGAIDPDPVPPLAASCAATSFCATLDLGGGFGIYDGATTTVGAAGPDGDETSVSCPTTSLCVTAGPGGWLWDSYRDPGASWQTAGGRLGPTAASYDAVSCASSSYCLVVSLSADYAVYTGGTSSPDWTLGTSFPTADGEPEAVSCVSTSFCEVATSTGWVVKWTGSAWSDAEHVDGTQAFTAISCPAATSCTAVDDEGDYVAGAGATWSAPAATGAAGLQYLSCPTTAFCLAAYGGSTAAWVWRGAGFSAPEPVAAAPPVAALSCAAARSCEAAAEGPTVDAEALSGSSWAPSAAVGSGIAATSMSCPTTSFCAAVGGADQAATWDGSSWSAASLAVLQGYSLVSVSCSSASYSAAVDSGGSYFYWDGTAWSASTGNGMGFEAPPSAVSCVPGASPPQCTAVTETDNAYTCSGTAAASCSGGTAWADTTTWGNWPMTSVSCPTTSFCAAGDADGGLYTWSGGDWSTADADGTVPVTAVSCAAAAFCVAGDAAGDVLEWGGSSWSLDPDELGSPVDDWAITALSCPTTSFCAAGDAQGDTLSTYDEGEVGPLYQVSCATAQSCTAVGPTPSWSGSDAIYSDNPLDPYSWSVASLPAADGELFAVACTSPTGCTAVGGYASDGSSASIVTTADGGGSWSPAPVPTNLGDVTLLAGVTCVPGAPADCFAVGEGDVSGQGSGAMLASTSGGSSWTTVDWTAEAGVLSGIACTAAPVCVASGDGGGFTQIYVAEDPVSSPSSWAQYTQSTQTGMSYLYGVSCTTGACYSYGWSQGTAVVWGTASLSAPSFSLLDSDAGVQAFWAGSCTAAACTLVGTDGTGATTGIALEGP